MASERVRRRIDRLLDEAEAAADAGDWARVRERARMVLSVDPQNADAQAFATMADEAGREAPADSGGVISPLPGDEKLEHSQDAGGPARRTVGNAAGAASASAKQAPTSFASGRYVVKKFLGEGGKKKVYLAHDTVLDRDVAFALIKTEGLDEAARTRVMREAQVMGRLGDPPNLMPIHDLGRECDQPFMVIPFMPGGDVEGMIEKANRAVQKSDSKASAASAGLPLKRTVEIAIAVCRGLDFAHTRSVIHRDLKPGNVWLTEDGTAKIGDWGLALPLEQTRLTAHGMMVGTVAYMPPEQALGGEITPKADLYSLGCMLYEMVTGRPPFLGDDHVAVIGQHINTPPVAPTWHRPDCPRPLEALIMRLLAKDPAQRPDSAKDVGEALTAVELGTSKPAEPADPAGRAEGRSLESLAEGVFVGRQKETGQLRAALEEALSGRGRVVMLVGEPGIGKTRTAVELATYAGLRRCRVLWGRCYESQGAPPYWPWVQAIRSYVRTREPQQLRTEMGSGAPEIAEIVSDVKERLPDLRPPVQFESPEQARFRLFDSITAFLKSASSTQPIVVVLDDLHWADKPSLLFLEFVARELTGARLLILGTYRDVELSRHHPLAETLGELNRERLFDRVLLRGLGKDDVRAFIELTSGVKPPQELVQAVHLQTEGNPLFVTEVVRLLVQEGHLTRERVGGRQGEKTTTWTVRIPEGVREVIGRRLNRLSARCNEALTVAAVLGREFTLKQLGAVTEDMTEDMLLQVIEEALAARVVEEIPTVVGRYQFTHALIQETLTNELSLTRRVRLHARIAEALERSYGQDAVSHAAELAYHFVGAEAILGSTKLVQYSLIAGEQALDRQAFEAAKLHFERAQTAIGDRMAAAEAGRVHFGLGVAENALLNPENAVKHFATAYDAFESAGDYSSTARVAQQFMVNAEAKRKMIALIERALPRTEVQSLRRGYLLTRLGDSLAAVGDYERAFSALDEAIDLAHRHGDAALELSAQSAAGYAANQSVKIDRAIRHGTRARALADASDDPLSAGYAYLMSIFFWLFHGDSELAASHMVRLLETSAASRNKQRIAAAHAASAWLAYELGDFGESVNQLNSSEAAWPEFAVPLGLRSVVELELGNDDVSATYFDRLSRLPRQPERLVLEAAHSLGEIILWGPELYRRNRDPKCLDVLHEVIGLLPQNDIRGWSYYHGRMCAGWVAVFESDPANARSAYIDVEGYLSGFGRYHVHLLGHLAWLMGDARTAEEQFREADRQARANGFRPALAWQNAEYAELLYDRGEPGDRDRAAGLWDEALATARELGMKKLIERIIARKKILKA